MITWTPGPPPAEWRDGRKFLATVNGIDVVIARHRIANVYSDSDGDTWGGEEITHHSAINPPTEGITK